MESGLIAFLLRFYPSWWRARYGAEFTALLEETPPRFWDVLNVLICAISIFLSPSIEGSMEGSVMHPVQRALPLSFAAWLMAVGAGINLWGSVDDNPLVASMRNHSPFMNSWMAIEAGSLIGLAAIVAAGVPLVAAILKHTHAGQRRRLLAHLLVLPGAAAVLLAWIGAVLISTQGSWAPMPWAITGDWQASASWPPLATRWVLGMTTLILLLAAGIGGAVSIRQIVRMAALPNLFRWSSVVRVSVGALAGALLLMALGTGLWGLFANVYAHDIFHAKWGGLLNLSTFSSWLASFFLFAAAAVVAIRGVRQYGSAV